MSWGGSVIHELAGSTDDVHVTADVCIVGGGTAGLFLAKRLRSHGLHVVILEGGARLARPPSESGHRCSQVGITYRGAESGRSFGLGGTSVLWGGQLLSLTPADVGPRPHAGFPSWPVAHDEIQAYMPAVLAELGLPGEIPGDPNADGSLATRHFPGLQSFAPDFTLRLSAWLPFARRNFAQAFRDTVEKDEHVDAWLDANVVSIDAEADDRGWSVRRIVARSGTGRQLNVSSRLYVLAAGALESTRLLLHYDEATRGAISGKGAPLGRHFADHLSATCGRFHCRDWHRFNLGVAPLFANGIMRTPRLELSGATQTSLSLSSAYTHFTFVTHGDTGFDVVRNFLRRRQGERQSMGISPSMLGRVVGDVSSMAYWRYAKGRLWIPRQAAVLLQVDIEQRPNPDSRISLDTARDEFGRRRLVIDWKITDDDLRTVRETARLTAEAWDRCSLRDTASLTLAPEATGDDFASLYDVYHPTGALRMGTNAQDSVVDPMLRVWGTENLYVSTTAVFPSAGSANPGLVHLALTARLADHLAAQATQRVLAPA